MSTKIMVWASAIAMAASLQGCSLLIRGSGVTLRDLDTREIVYDRFGQPDSVSVLHAIDPQTSEVRQFEVEHYHVHAKYNTAMPCGYMPAAALLFEPVMICQATFAAAGEYIKGHDLEFVYDEQGNTIGHRYPRPFLDAVQRSRDEVNVLLWERPDVGQESSGASGSANSHESEYD